MSAAELIEQIKALPPADVEVIRKFLLNYEDESNLPKVRYLSNEEAKRIAARVFDRHADLFRKLAQ